MAKLWNQTQNKVLLSDLRIAQNFLDRAIGLLSSSSLSEQQGLWIHRCNSIHTWFMRFSIDCVFLDSELKVKKVVKQVAPFRIVFPVWGAASVVELAANHQILSQITVGDQLHVET